MSINRMSSIGSVTMSNRKTRARQKSNANEIFYANKNFSNTVKNFSTGGKISTKKNSRNLTKVNKRVIRRVRRAGSVISSTRVNLKISILTRLRKTPCLIMKDGCTLITPSKVCAIVLKEIIIILLGWNMVTDLIWNTEDFYFK